MLFHTIFELPENLGQINVFHQHYLENSVKITLAEKMQLFPVVFKSF